MNRLWVRLSLAFLIIAWLSVGAIAAIVHITTERSFRHYLNRRDAQPFSPTAVAALEDYYRANQDWSRADALLPGPRGGAGQGQGRGAGQGQGSTETRGGATALLADADGVIRQATDPELLGTTIDADIRANAISLTVDGQTVGYLAQITPSAQVLGEAEEQFLSETDRWLIVAALGASLLAVIVGGLLAWQMTRPLRTLTDTAHDLAGGKFGQQVKVSGAVEITDLADAFNHMSRDLAQGETLRQRMAADIAHELRTPVSVLRGHLEAMLDGVFPLDADHLAVAYDRTIHMSRLVDDLRLLTRAEAGQLPLECRPVAANVLIERALESFAPLALDAEITLQRDIAPNLPAVNVDADRLQQVFGNLLTNALRHTYTNGTIAVRAWRVEERVRFSVSNTGQGLTADDAQRVFTPFWRAEDARERDTGGSGLGLAITQQLLLLHGGRIWVESAPAQTTFVFELPAV